MKINVLNSHVLTVLLILVSGDLCLGQQGRIQNKQIAQVSESASHKDLINYFRILTEIPASNSLQYKSVLNWVEKMETVQFNLSWSDAIRIKSDIEKMIEDRVSIENVLPFQDLIHKTGLINIYNEVPSNGNLYDQLSLIDGRMDSSLFTEQDIKIIKRIMSKEGLSLAQLKKFLRPLKQFVPDGMLYNGFPTIFLAEIISSGLRSGLAYGPPGSKQIEGIFTTSSKDSSINWGRVKAISFGATNDKKNAHIYSIQSSPDELVFDLPNEQNEVKSKLLRASYELGLFSVRKKLSPYARHLVSRDGIGKSFRFSVILALLDTKLFRTTIFMDVGIAMGKELVIVDRRSVQASQIETSDGLLVLQNDRKQLISNKLQRRKQFSDQMSTFIKQGKMSEAVTLYTDSVHYFISNPHLMSEALKSLSAVEKSHFLQAIMKDYRYKNLSLLGNELLANSEVLLDNKAREALKHYFTYNLIQSNFYEQRFESLLSIGFSQRFAIKYLNFLSHNFPEEFVNLMMIVRDHLPDYKVQTNSVINNCSRLYF